MPEAVQHKRSNLGTLQRLAVLPLQTAWLNVAAPEGEEVLVSGAGFGSVAL
jgi:hypothetical protein